MEYMLMPDGTVRTYDCIALATKVVDELIAQGGLAYYWCSVGDTKPWNRIDLYTHTVINYNGPIHHTDPNPPEVILLAQMLE